MATKKYLNLDLLVADEVIIELKGRKWDIAGMPARKALNLMKMRDSFAVEAENGDKAAGFLHQCNALAGMLGKDLSGKEITGEEILDELSMNQIVALTEFIAENLAPEGMAGGNVNPKVEVPAKAPKK